MIDPWRWVDPRIREVRLPQVRNYFLQKGWREETCANPEMLRFAAPNSKIYQVFPASDEFDSYRQRLMELITLLSEWEGRHPVAILEDMLASVPEGANGPVAAAPADPGNGAPRPRSKKRSRK